MSIQPIQEHQESDTAEVCAKYDITLIGAEPHSVNDTLTSSIAADDNALDNMSLRVVEHATLCEWSTQLKTCWRELGDTPDRKHSLFTRKNVLSTIRQLVSRKQVKITRIEQQQSPDGVSRDVLNLVFSLSARSEFLPEIIDDLAFTLEMVPQSDSELALKRLMKHVDTQEAEIARLARIIANQTDFSRAMRINEMIVRTVALYGPLSARMFAVAQRVFAAEVDGAPIVFRVLGCDAPIWLRSVIRYANARDPTPIQVTIQGNTTFALPHDASGGNEMSSAPMSLSQWIYQRSAACYTDTLVIAPIFASECPSARCKFDVAGVQPDALTNVRAVIFGNTYCEQSPYSECDASIERCITSLAGWTKNCASVRIAHMGVSSVAPNPAPVSTPARSSVYAGHVGKVDSQLAQAYDSAIDMKDGDPSPNRWIYPMQIYSLSANLHA